MYVLFFCEFVSTVELELCQSCSSTYWNKYTCMYHGLSCAALWTISIKTNSGYKPYTCTCSSNLKVLETKTHLGKTLVQHEKELVLSF